MNEIRVLFWKEVKLELRQRYALNGMVLYIVSTVFICYLHFNLNQNLLNPIVWNTLFWIILMFTAVNAIGKSFSQDSDGRILYYYTLTSPIAIILAKIIYNSLLMTVLTLSGFLVYQLAMGNPVDDLGMFLLALLLGSIGFASVLTMISAIASKAGNNGMLMAVLSFPMVIPLLLMAVKMSKNAMDGLDASVSYDEIAVLLAIDALVIALSLILFPYIWKS
ncbi:heme exporter protein CcmB [Ravibacter arvi]|uniref:heme exporter protein CcmB n=1 Tax=Ravibacter arvi TaxID=2051041 RepID=UPI0031E7BB4C